MRAFANLAELAACVGEEIARSEWVEITQEKITQFAEATGDRQWIHVDAARAATGPFGAPIAHGFMTLSLLPALFASSIEVGGAGMAVNYGLNKLRFIAPVHVGSRLRARLRLNDCVAVEQGGLQTTWQVTVEREGVVKPVCVAEWLLRHYP